MKEIIKKRKPAFLIFCLLAVTAVGATIAYFSSQKDFGNEFRVKAPGVAMEEKFNPADHWVPGEEKAKEVWFTNTGQMDMLLRFSVDIQWDETVPHPDRDPKDVIGLYWYGGEKGGECIRIPARSADGTHSDAAPVGFKQIVQDGRAYFYYEKVLKAGESTQHTLESVKFATNLSNDGHNNSDFSDTRLLVTIRGETVLADSDAVQEWRESPQIKAVISGDDVSWSTAENEETTN